VAQGFSQHCEVRGAARQSDIGVVDREDLLVDLVAVRQSSLAERDERIGRDRDLAILLDDDDRGHTARPVHRQSIKARARVKA
jgi:hypothetical protein